jgi:hypothetical protein
MGTIECFLTPEEAVILSEKFINFKKQCDQVMEDVKNEKVRKDKGIICLNFGFEDSETVINFFWAPTTFSKLKDIPQKNDVWVDYKKTIGKHGRRLTKVQVSSDASTSSVRYVYSIIDDKPCSEPYAIYNLEEISDKESYETNYKFHR